MGLLTLFWEGAAIDIESSLWNKLTKDNPGDRPKKCKNLEAMANSIKEKLNPARFPGMSSKMVAIVTYVLGMEPLTNPHIVELTVTSDGFLLARNEGEIGFDNFLGSIEDYKANWEKLITIPEVGLTPGEIAFVRERYREAICHNQ